MSWEDKDIDDLFKEAAESVRFEYRDAYFDAIDAQLPLRKRRVGWIWLSVLALVLTVGGLWMFKGADVEMGRNQISTSDEVNLTIEKVGETSTEEIGTIEKSEFKDTTSEVNYRIAKATETTVQQPEISSIENRVPEQQLANDSQSLQNEEEIKLAQNEIGHEILLTNDEDQLVSNEGKVDSNHEDLVMKDESLNEELIINAPHDLAVVSPSLKNKRAMFVEAGAGLGQSYIRSLEGGTNKMTTYSFQLGYSYQRGSWSYQAAGGINYKSFNNLNIADRSEIYGFGLTTYENRYSFSSLTSAQLSIGLNYTVKKHKIGLSVSTLIPVSTRITYEEFENGEMVASGSAYVDNSYFRMSIEPELRYLFSLNKSIDLGLKVFTPIWNPINSDRILGERAAMPINGQVVMKWNLGL